MGNYGYLHLGRVLSYDAGRDAYSLESVGLARTSRCPPVPSCVPGLQPGDRVVLAATGVSRDNLIIIAKVDADYPGIPDIPGLQAALDGKADDAEITALDARLDAAEAGLVDLDTRLDAIDTTLAALNNRIYHLELTPFRASRDLYTDSLATMDRDDAVNPITLVNGTIYAVRMYGLPALTAAAIRMAVAVAGTVGTATVGLYTGSATNALTQVRTGSITLTTTGRVTHTFAGAYTTTGPAHFVVALLPLAYTVAPQVGGRSGVIHSSLLNPSTALATSVTKAGQATLPASIDLTDGSWTTAVTSKIWVALG